LKSQLAEIDRRPWQPRQLAGAKGSSELRGKSAAFGAAPVVPVDAASDPIGPLALADRMAADAATIDVSFKPKCLAIRVSPL